MTETPEQPSTLPDDPLGLARSQVLFWVCVVLVVAAIAAVQAFRIADAEYKRDLRQWEIRMGITADIRAAAAREWVDRQKAELAAVADNTSLRLYITELEDAGSGADAAEAQYLNNYIVDTARKSGFVDEAKPALAPASVEYHGRAGMALLDKQGRAVVTTDGMPALSGELQQALAAAPRGEVSMKDIYLDATGKPAIMFIAPVFGVQGEVSPDAQIGTVVGIKPVDELYTLLKRPQVLEKTAETLLIRVQGQVAEYISPLADGAAPLERKLDLATDKNYDVAFAVKQPERFGIKRDYAFHDVLMTSRKVEGTPWLLLHKIDRKEALEESDQRRASIITLSLMGIGLMALVVFAVWRHGASVRYRHMATRFRSQERLLRLVTDNQPDSMYILDKDNRYRFANLKAAHEAESSKEDMMNKTVGAVLGAAYAQELSAVVNHVLEAHEKITHIRRVADEQGRFKRVLQARYIPLERVPRVLTGGEVPGVLVVEQDITAAITERERRERLLGDLVETLVMVVDKRDKYSAYHSKKVAVISDAIGREMRLDEVSVETVRQAALLMNLGKVMLPVALLTKKGKLTAAEKNEIAKAVASTADYLEGMEFNGPVVETIRQAQEHMDGSGPLGLKGDAITLTAQIISLANDFVAMISPRAYRDAIRKDKALEQLMEQVGARYHRKVVVALVNYIENTEDAFVDIPERD